MESTSYKNKVTVAEEKFTLVICVARSVQLAKNMYVVPSVFNCNFKENLIIETACTPCP